MRAALPEVIDDRRAERAAFDRVGAAADFVEQHERRQFERAVHRDDVRDVRRERAEARGDRLLVADVREDRTERRERGCRPRPESAVPACAISASRPNALSATVLPPVFGPEITSARVGGTITRSDAIDDRRPARPRPSTSGSRTAGISSGCRAPRNSMRPSATSARRDAVHARASRALACSSSSSGGRRRRARPARPAAGGTRSSAPSRMRWISSRSRSASATTSLFSSTVASGSRYRLAPLRRAAVHDARDRVAMFGAHDDHVPAVAVGDDLVLQVLRVSRPRVRPSSVERSFARCRRSASRMSRSAGLASSLDVAGRQDRAPDRGDLAGERRRAARDRGERGKPPPSRSRRSPCARHRRGRPAARSRETARGRAGASGSSGSSPMSRCCSRLSSRSSGASRPRLPPAALERDRFAGQRRAARAPSSGSTAGSSASARARPRGWTPRRASASRTAIELEARAAACMERHRLATELRMTDCG